MNLSKVRKQVGPTGVPASGESGDRHREHHENHPGASCVQ